MSDGDRLLDIEWRFDNLYQIKNKYGQKVKFVRNSAQLKLWNNIHTLNIILKDRQRGFSTSIAILILDNCLFNSNQSCGIIDLSLPDAKKKLAKIKFAYDNLPEAIREKRPLTTDNKELLEWSNGSSVAVGTSHRGGTCQILHISEFGAIAARRPDRAREIRTGALNTVAPGCFVFIESTGEGKGGEFFDYVQEARKLRDEGGFHTDLDFKLHFYAWWHGGENTLPAEYVQNYTQEQLDYFEKVEVENSIILSPDHRAWYVKKKAQQKDDMVREYPSSIDEAFESSVDGAYYAKKIITARKAGRITRVPYEESLHTITAWDLGMDDAMSIWFIQAHGLEYRLIDYYENSGEGFPHYAQVLRDRGYYYSAHLMPHDAAVRELGTGRSRIEAAEALGIKPIERVPRARGPEEVNADIDSVRAFLGSCWIDKEKCAKGIDALEAYRKDWDERLGVFKSSPRKDWAGHGADALRTFVKGIKIMGGLDFLNSYNNVDMNLSAQDYSY